MNKQFQNTQETNYKEGEVYEDKSTDLTNFTISVSETQSFKAIFPNMFEKYKLPFVESDAIVQNCHNSMMQFGKIN